MTERCRWGFALGRGSRGRERRRGRPIPQEPMMKLSTLTVALCVGAIALPAAAQRAQSPADDDTTSTMRIHVGDLDPGHAEGAAVLLNRVMWSAAIACGP